MPEDTLMTAFRLMRLSRAVDRFAVALQRQGVFGTFGEARGQEATLAGAAVALDPRVDWIVPQYRELPALVHHGLPLELLFLMYTYNPKGFTVPEGVNALCNQVSLAAQLPQAVGLAWGLRLQQREGVVLAFVGDGGASEGDFFEACNLAGVTKAPVVFVVQNNGWAISTPVSYSTAGGAFAQRGPAYDMPGVTVDGMDPFAVYEAVETAVARARAGEGPSLIEAKTMRFRGHFEGDPGTYRGETELSEGREHDPIPFARRHLTENGVTEEELAKLEASVDAEVAAAREKALKGELPGRDRLTQYIYV